MVPETLKKVHCGL